MSAGLTLAALGGATVTSLGVGTLGLLGDALSELFGTSAGALSYLPIEGHALRTVFRDQRRLQAVRQAAELKKKRKEKARW